MKYFLYLLFLIVTPTSLKAQDINIGLKHQLFSKILDEKRTVWIHLPESYNDTINYPEKYPVLYLLDGDWQFHSLVAVQESLTGGYYNYMPEMIIVGVLNTDRSRDLTPSKGKVIHNGKVIYQTSGGADNFMKFLSQELRTYIDTTYRTNGYNMLEGHSFGGLFTIYTLITKPQLFNAYIANDPSLWWDNKYVFHLAKKNWSKIALQGRILYLSLANHNNSEKDKFEHTLSIEEFGKNILKKQKTLRFKWEYFENEDHGTVSLPASYAAMKYIFKGICLPVKQIPENTNLITEHFNSLSDSIGFNIRPSQQLIANMISYCKQVDKAKSAEELLQYMIQLYPKNNNAKKQLQKLKERDL